MKIQEFKSQLHIKLMALLLFAGLTPLFIVGSLNYVYSVDMITQEVEQNLQDYAKVKAGYIHNYFNQKRQDIAALAKMPGVIESASALIQAYQSAGIQSESYKRLDRRSSAFLRYNMEMLGYYDLFMISLSGDVVFSVLHESDFATNLKQEAYKTNELARGYEEVLVQLESTITNFSFYQPSNSTAVFTLSPIFDQGRLLAILAAQIDAKHIYALLSRHAGLGKKSGDTIIATRINGEAVFLNPVAEDQNAPFRRKVALGSALGIPIQRASLGGNGAGQFLDYLGEPVIAAWRYLPHLRIGMVVKQNKSEAFEKIEGMRSHLLWIGFFTLLVLSIGAFLIARSINIPVKNLIRAMRHISSGDLSYRTNIRTSNEVGYLSSNFDQMMKKLQTVTASRDELNREVSERRQAELALAENQRLIQDLLNSTAEAIIGIDASGVCTFANPASLRLLKYSHDSELVGHNIHQKIHYRTVDGSDYPEQQCPMSITLQTGENTHTDREVLWRADGSSFPVEYWSYPVLREGVVNGSVLTFMDISERKQAEQERVHYQQNLEREVQLRTAELEVANQDLEGFSYSVSHDLRSPLRAIDGFVNILQEDYAPRLDQEGLRLLGVVSQNAQKMGELIDDILQFSRAGRLEMELTSIDMNSLLAEVWAGLAEQRGQIPYQFEQQDLPPVEGDIRAIRQVWQNLLSNAIKFSAHANPPVIRVSALTQSAEVRFSVSDNGAGFNPEYVNKLFVLFQRLHSMNEFEGSGVGLAIVKRFVQKHGGRIEASGTPNKGACFSFTLPLNRSISTHNTGANNG